MASPWKDGTPLPWTQLTPSAQEHIRAILQDPDNYVVRESSQPPPPAHPLTYLHELLPQLPAFLFQYSWDAEQREQVHYISESLRDVLGFDPKYILSGERHWLSAVSEEARQRIKASIEESFHTGEVWRAEVSAIARDGSPRTLLMISAPVRCKDGGMLWNGIGIDITARVEARRALEQLAAELETSATILEQLLMSVVVTDDAWKIQQWSAQKITHYGFSDEVAPTTLSLDKLFGPQTLERWEHIFAEQDVPSTYYEEETYCICKDGTRLPVEVRLRHLCSSDQRDTRWVVLIHDISERRGLEEELQQAQKMETLGMLTSGIAHDLNNLLTVMLGHLELAKDDLDPDHLVRKDLEGIRAAVDRATAMTVKLLAFARAQVVEPQVIDLIDLLNLARPLLERSLPEDISLKLSLSPAAPPVRVDVVQIEQLLINLVINARDAIDARAGEIIISVVPHALRNTLKAVGGEIPPGNYLVLGVRDDGTGMTEETMARIFQPFFTTKREGQGTGLGLATCLRIVHQNGGHIRFESEAGAGSLFEVWLPRAYQDTNEAAAISSVDIEFGSGDLLLVEDDRALRNAIERMLLRYGYDVTTARNGAEAIAVINARRFPPDLVITDVVMPRMGGGALLEHLHAKHPNTPVLFISGYTEELLATRSVHIEHVEFLPKPFTPSRLAYRIQELLQRAAHAEQE